MIPKSPSEENAYLISLHVNGIVPAARPIFLKGGNTAVLLLHGFTSSPHEFADLAPILNNYGFTVHAPLLPGHGTTPQALLAVKSSDWTLAVEYAYDELLKTHSTVYVLGFSLGGALALHLALHRNISRLVLVAPWIKVCDEHALSTECIIHLFWPFLSWQVKKSKGDIRNPLGEKEHFAYYCFTPRAVRQALRIVERVKRKLGKITSPLLLIHSEHDRTMNITGSHWLYSRVASPNKEFMILKNSGHIVFRDYESNVVNTKIVEFFCRKMS
jgi:carboxylesterase